MKNLILIASASTLAATLSFAAGSHDGGHSHKNHEEADHKTPESAAEHGHTEGHDHSASHAEMMAIGMPGKSENVDRTIDVVMRETDDGDMIFEPSAFDIKQGETIRFNVTNKGELEHEFVVDTVDGNSKHKEAMAKMDMEHDDPNSVRLDPGESGEIIWKFANAGTFEHACLIPGHYESGMHGPITVAANEVETGKDSAEAKSATYTKGVVKKIKRDSGKVTIIHEELVDLEMPAMTMVFRVEDDALLDGLSEGQEIEFLADRVKGKLTVTKLK